MDDIFDSDIITTAQLLSLDRLLLLKFTYKSFVRDVSPSFIPSAEVEVVYHWHSDSANLFHHSFSYTLSESFLTIHAWQQAPAIVKVSNKSELAQLIEQNKSSEISKIFDYDYLESLLIIPLCKQKSESLYKPVILGLLVMQNSQSRDWPIRDIEIAKWMAKQITSVWINQQTIVKVQSLVNERTAQLQVSLDVQAKLGHQLRNYLEELKRVNKIKDEFIASLSDAFKTPLSNIKMGIKMLKLINTDEKTIKYLDILKDECDKEINLVNNLLTLQELQSNKLNIEPQKIYLQPLLTDFYNFFSQELHYQHKKLIIDAQQEYLYTDLNSLNLIIKELITNASKFSDPETDILFKIYPQESDTIIQVSNYGFSIPDTEQKSIFQPFYQGKHVENVTNSGTGLGLALVESLVHNLNGAIEVSSKSINESKYYLNTFTIIFPQLMNDRSSV